MSFREILFATFEKCRISAKEKSQNNLTFLFRGNSALFKSGEKDFAEGPFPRTLGIPGFLGAFRAQAREKKGSYKTGFMVSLRVVFGRARAGKGPGKGPGPKTTRSEA